MIEKPKDEAQGNALGPLLHEQSEYYRERAPEYDDWWFRRGRYDRGSATNEQWRTEKDEVCAALDRFAPQGEVIELACGTGVWSERLLRNATRLTVVDASAEMLQRCRTRLADPSVRYVQANLFAWEPDRTYDLCFLAFWLSHVPDSHFDSFWEKVERMLKPNGRVFLVDSLASDIDAHVDREDSDPGGETAIRRLSDGREFRIVKRFHSPQELQLRLTALGWDATVKATGTHFIHGDAKRGSAPQR